MLLKEINNNLNRIATALEAIAKIESPSDTKELISMSISSPNIELLEKEEEELKQAELEKILSTKEKEKQFFIEDALPVELLD